MQRRRVTVWYTAPTAIRMMMKLGAAAVRDHELGALRFMASVGEPLNPEAVIWGVEAFGQPFHDNWWQTETGGIVIANFLGLPVKPGSMGLPLPGIEAAIVERRPDGSVSVVDEPMVEGELALKAGWPSMMRGYLQEDERYRKCFAGAWYLTGRDALLADPKIFVMGEDIGRYGGCYAVTKGLLDEFGEDRIRDTPLSESAFVGAGIGAALAGMRPIVEIMTVNFSLLALDQIVNNAATIPYMSGGQFAVPLVIRMATGGGRRVGAQHSHSLEGWYAHIPGLRILAPAVVEDARFMLAAALADPNPVLIFEHVMLYNIEAALDPAVAAVDIDRAKRRREGTDVTLVAYGNGLFKALAAADLLATDGIAAEVIDLRVLRPLDTTTILASVAKTRRVVIVDEAWKSGSLAAEIGMRIVEEGFFDLDAPPRRVCGREVPMPYAPHLEDAALPQPAEIAAAARALVRPEKGRP